MTLAEYLASEQARESVKALLDGREEFVGPDGICLITGPEGKWRAVNALDDAGELLARAYYRPDGDRYVVTDLGEGVRAYELRTGRLYFAGEEITKLDAACQGMKGPGYRIEVGTTNLPDALCRVMLASLRVAQS